MCKFMSLNLNFSLIMKIMYFLSKFIKNNLICAVAGSSLALTWKRQSGCKVISCMNKLNTVKDLNYFNNQSLSDECAPKKECM